MGRPRDPELTAERRSTIMAATYRLLIEDAWPAVTLAKVAEAADVSKGLVRYYFGSKEALITETIEWFLAAQLEAVFAIARMDAPPRDRLQLLLEVALPEHEETEAQLRFQLEVWSFAKTHPEILATVREGYAQFRRACAELLAIGEAEGYAAGSGDPTSYLMLHALLDGLTFQCAVDPGLDVKALRARALEVIERLVKPKEGQPRAR